MQISTYEHVFPLKKTCGISPLEHQASGILEKYFLLVFSPPGDLSLSPWRISLSLSDVISLNDKLWCDLSLPLWHQFPRRASGICHEWVWSLSHNINQWLKNVMLVEDKIHWVELDQKKHRISGKLFFLWWNRWHRVVCFGCTERIRIDRKQETGVIEFITEKTLVTLAH